LGRETVWTHSERLGRADLTFEVDSSEIAGRSYRCLDGCALCCLCQPELLPAEESTFRRTPGLSEGVADKHISPDVRGAAIKLRGQHGACYFLTDRRCQAYTYRPHFCRAFPINIFVGWRIQLNANLSCRGIGLEGESLEELGRSALSDYPEAQLASEVKKASRVFSDFIQNCRATWTAQSFSSVRSAGAALMDDLADEIELGRIFAYAERGTTAQNASAKDIMKQVRRTEPEGDLHERALVDGTELFDLPDMSLLPIYVDSDLRWHLFRLVGKEIVGYVLSEDGTTEETSRTSPDEVALLPMTRAGKDEFVKYLGIVNRRDCFLGHAAYLCDSEGYEYNFGQVYLGALATNALDLWWRSSLLAMLRDKEDLGPAEVLEGIVFFDMDLLDLPTIGAFV